MHFNWPPFAIAVPAALSACAAPAEQYPSLAIRDAERVSGTMAPAAAPYVPPPTSTAVLGQLDRLVADAAAAHRDFSAAAPATRTAVAAARGSGPGAETWARAQVALAGLQASRSRAMIALADLDRLYVDAAVAEDELARIAAARDTVTAQVAEQDAAIDGLAEGLRQ